MRVTAVVPVYNGESYLESCLAALLLEAPEHLHVVVVDDGSTDSSVDVAARIAAVSGGRVEVVRRSCNGGFAAAVNQGCAYALSGRFPPQVLVFVNQDCVVSSGWLAPLLETLVEDDVAVVGARLLDADGVTLQHAGACVGANGLTRHLGRGSQDPAAWRDKREVEYVCGALFAVSSNVWLSLGGFDEGYAPAYFEEVDFCLRARSQGRRVVYVPTSEAVHVEAACSGASSSLYLERYHRSRIRFVVRHLWPHKGALAWLRAEAGWVLSLRTWKEIAPVLSAYRQIPRLLVERHRASRRDSAPRGAECARNALVRNSGYDDSPRCRGAAPVRDGVDA